SAEWVRGLSALGWGGSIGSLWFTAVIVELVMVCRSVSRPASGRFAVNQWTQLTLTRRVPTPRQTAYLSVDRGLAGGNCVPLGHRVGGWSWERARLTISTGLEAGQWTQGSRSRSDSWEAANCAVSRCQRGHCRRKSRPAPSIGIHWASTPRSRA